MKAVIIATGESLTKDQVSSVKRWRQCCGSGCCGNPTDDANGSRLVLAVSDAYKLAPWADALVSQDKPWWNYHKPDFAGRKFSGGREDIDGVERVKFQGLIGTGTNSALLACHVAVTVFGATSLVLLGVDMGGAHFFGKHPEPLKNTSPDRFETMKWQFKQWHPKGLDVVNCSPNSALTCFPMGDIDDCLFRPA